MAQHWRSAKPQPDFDKIDQSIGWPHERRGIWLGALLWSMIVAGMVMLAIVYFRG